MPRSIAEIRKANGGLDNLTDEDILQSTFQQYKSYYPSIDAYAAEVGYGGAGRSLAGSRVSAGIDQYKANLQGLGGAVSRAVGAEGLAAGFDRSRAANEAAAAYAAQQARDLGGVEDWRDVTGVGSALNFAGGLAAQSLPYVGEAVVGGLTGGAALAGTAARVGLGRAAAATAGAVGASYPSAVGDILSAQREAGGENLGAAALGGVPYAALNAIGVEGMAARGLRPLIRGEAGVARRMATGAAEGVIGEGFGETGQELVNQYAGRMAVNPNETLFNDEANKRYLDSFIGGATLGGLMGGVGGIRAPRQDVEKDLTQPDTTITEQQPAPRTTLTGLDTAALMGSPYANANLLGGTANQPFVSSSLYSQEADLTAPAGTAATPVAETPAATTPGTTVPPAGETKPTAPSLFSETDTGLNKLGVEPTKNSRAVYDYLVAENIDPASPEAEPVMNALAASKVGEARKAVGEIIRARSPRGTGISTVQQPTGGLGVGGPVVPGVVGNTGSPVVAAGGAVQPAGTAGAPVQQAGILPSAAGQPSTPVTTGAPSGTQAPQTIEAAPQGQTTAAVQPAAPIKANTTLRLNQQEKLPGETDIANIADIARMTGNDGGIDAVLEDEAGLRADQRDFTENDLNDLIDEQLGKGKNKERDRKILRGYILSRRLETEGTKGDLVKEIAATFGITEDRVRQIGNPEKLAKLAVEKGFDRNQVFDILGIESAQKKVATKLGKLDGELTRLKAKAKPTKADIARMAELDEQITRINDEVEAGDMAAAFKEAGIEGEAGEAFGNLDDAREWQKASTAGSQMAVKLVSIADTIAELKAAAAELNQLGLTQAEAAAAERVNELTAEYEAIVAGYEAKPEAEAAAPKKGKGKGKAKSEAAEKVAEEKDAAKEAEAAKFRAERAAKLQADRNGLAVGDTVKNPKLGTGVVKSFAGDGDATTVTVAFQSGQTKELSVKLAKLEKTDAVQVESAASVPVQPKAEIGEKVGRQVRRAPKPATESKAPTVILTQAEQAAEAWDKVAADFPEAPKFADLTKAQQNNFIGFGPDNWERGDVELELTKMARAAAPTQRAIGREPVTIDVEARVIDETVAPQVAKLPAPQVTRLENHYGVKKDSPEFLAKVKADVVLYATKGAEAVAGAIRDIIKAIHAGVLSVAMIFNPTAVSQIEAFVVIPQETQTTTQQVLAELPAEVQGMSEAGKQAYATLIPALKGKIGDKFVTIADKPSGRVFVFKANGDLVLQKKALFGLAKGDLYKGNNDLKQNRVTPAGLFGIHVVDAAKGGAAATTAGEYDFGKVFALDDPDATVTFMHSVWLKESDAAKRAAALKNDSAADSRYSFGCINLDKEMFKDMVTKYSNQMDGSKLFVVPDVQSTVNDFITGNVANDRLVREGVQPVTKTTTTPVKSATQTASVDRTVAAKEEETTTDLAPKLRALRTVTTVDEDNASVELQEQELARLEAVPGVGAATDRMRKEGLGDLVDYVGGWYTTDSKVNWDGGFTAIDGQAAVLLRRGALTDSQRVEWTVYHEVGHAADQTHLEGGGVFSSLPEFNVRLQNGQIKPMGAVMKAAFDHYTNDPTSDLSKHLSYPFDRAKHGDLDGNGIREELFAQLWAAYTTRDGREFLEDNLPVVADFMEQVYEQVKQTDYAAAKANEAQRTAQAGGQAAQGNGQPRQVPLRQASVRFRANRQAKVDSAVSKLPKQAQQPVRSSINTISDWMRQGLDRLVFTSDLINRAVSAGIESAAKFQSLLAKRDTKARSLEREVERVADMYAGIEEKHKGDGPNSVNQFLFESTRTGKWGYDSGKFKADPKMAAMFNALGPKAQAYVKAIFTHGGKMLSDKKKAVVDYATSEYDARIAAETDPLKKAKLVKDKANDLKRFARLFKIREGIPYAPIKRFGDHVVVAKSKEYIAAKAANDSKLVARLEKDPDHYHVSFTETKNEARNLAEQLEAQGFFSGGTVAFKERSVADKELFGSRDSLGAITRLRAMADAKANAGDKGAAMMQRMVSDMYLQALAEGSARKSEMRRRGVSGEIDMLRSFAAQGRADANFVASVEYNPQIQDAIQAMRKEENQGSGDLNRKSEILNEITRRYESSLDATPTPTINKITRLSSIYYLATSPAYYLQNLTQPWMMSVPAMAGRHNYGKVSAALFAAYGQLGGVMKSARYDQQFDFDKVPADVRDAIQELANRGKIDIGLETELGEFKIDGDGKFSKGWNKVDKFLRISVQKVEALNRLSTAMAAYRLELAETGDKQKAIDYADRILTETHGDYSSFNAPRAFNNPIGKVALQFRKFQLIQLTYYAKLLKDAGFDSKEKRAATKALVYSLGHTGLLAGAMGLPGYSAIAWAIGALFGDDDDPLDVTAELRKFIGDEATANLIMRGAPTLAGVDVSGKVGAGNMLSIMPFSQADLTTKAGVIEAAGTLLGGAPVGMVARVADGLGQMLGGEWYKGMEQVLPKGLGDAAKAYRISTQGMSRRNGDVVLPADEVSAWEATVQALGIQPVQQSVVMERQQNTLEMNQFYQDRSTKIKAEYVKAMRAGEPTAEVRAAWNKLQEARVKNGYTRQPMSELFRAPQSQAKRAAQTVNGVQFNKTNKRFVEEQV